MLRLLKTLTHFRKETKKKLSWVKFSVCRFPDCVSGKTNLHENRNFRGTRSPGQQKLKSQGVSRKCCTLCAIVSFNMHYLDHAQVPHEEKRRGKQAGHPFPASPPLPYPHLLYTVLLDSVIGSGPVWHARQALMIQEARKVGYIYNGPRVRHCQKKSTGALTAKYAVIQ